MSELQFFHKEGADRVLCILEDNDYHGMNIVKIKVEVTIAEVVLLCVVKAGGILMLRRSFINDVKKNLCHEQIFTEQDFYIDQSLKNDEIILWFEYKAIREHYFRATIPVELDPDDGEIFITLNPGFVVREETEVVEGIDVLLKEIRKWVLRLREEIEALAFEKEEEMAFENISKIEELLKDIPQDKFSSEEITDLKARLERLEKAFIEKLERDEKDTEKLNKEVGVIQSEVSLLKKQTLVFDKKVWLRTFMNKVTIWKARNSNAVKELSSEGMLQISEEVTQEDRKRIHEIFA